MILAPNREGAARKEKAQHMAEEKKDREPWISRIEQALLFVNSADYERGVGHASNPLDITAEELEDVDEEKESPIAPDTFAAISPWKPMPGKSPTASEIPEITAE
jgi:hypothetical protein